MKNHSSKAILYLLILLSTSQLCLSSEETITNIDAQSTPAIILAQQREEIESLISAVKIQAEQINFCLQQISLACHANKLHFNDKQKKAFIIELTEIKKLIDYILEPRITQTSLPRTHLEFALVNAASKYLLKAIKTDLLTINAQNFNAIMDRLIQKNRNDIKPEAVQLLKTQNEKHIEELLGHTDFIGLTWLNKTSRFLKKNHAYDIARGATVLAISTVAAACLYNSYFRNIDATFIDTDTGWLQRALNKLGHPEKTQSVLMPDANNNLHKVPVIIPGKGILGNCSSTLKAVTGCGLISVSPFLAFDLKGITSSIYYQYWLQLQAKASSYINQVDATCTGSEVKYDSGDCEKVYFNDMTGTEHLEELAKRITNSLQHPERYERTGTEEHRCVLLWGPPQTGKTLFVKALKTMIDDHSGQDKKITFVDGKKMHDSNRFPTIDMIFEHAKRVAPCILFFDELDLLGSTREKNSYNTGQLLTNIQGIDMASKQVFIIGATNKLEQLDKALLVDGRFGKIIHIGYPSYQHRKSYLEKQLAKRNIKLDPTFIDHMAQETEETSYNDLKRIITDSLNISTNALRSVTQADFETTFDTIIRKIDKSTIHLSPEEKRIIATHQAGKALIRHLLQTKKEIVKITILPVSKKIKTNECGYSIKTDHSKGSDNDKLAELPKEQKVKNGEVFTKTDTTNAALVSNKENKKESMCLLAGHVAHKVVFNDLFAQCNPQDQADAMQTIYSIISQGEAVDKAMRAKATEIKEQYEAEIMQLLTQHKNTLEMIINKLVEQNSIDRYEWKELIKDCPTA